MALNESVCLYQALLTRANADLQEATGEPDAAKRAWLGGRAQALLSLANYLRDEAVSGEGLEAVVETRMMKAVQAVNQTGLRDYAIGKVAGLNLVRRLLRKDMSR